VLGDNETGWVHVAVVSVGVAQIALSIEPRYAHKHKHMQARFVW
jgi:hypothetical protein